MKTLFDTNILIDYIKGVPETRNIFITYPAPMISIVTWIEVMVGVNDMVNQELVKDFFLRFHIVNIDQKISEITVSLRKQHKIKLPDALIWASAKAHNATLITRNTKDFSEKEPDIYYPYQPKKCTLDR